MSAKILASTQGQGDAGTIDITAQDSVVFNGVSSDGTQRSGAFSVVAEVAEGEARDVTINTNSLTVSNGALISSDLFGKGKAGNVNITAEDIVFDGLSNGFSSGASSALRQGAEGQPGKIDIQTGSLEVTNGAQISASTEGIGNAGTINITAQDSVVFDGRSSNGLSSSAFSEVKPEAEGNAGNISITASSLEVTNGGIIDASTKGNGDGGSIIVEATERFNLDNDSQLSVETNSTGIAGDIKIDTPELNIRDNAQISATAKENATNTDEVGGKITINSNELNISSPGGILAETKGEAPAGTLNLNTYNDNPDLDINFSNQGAISASTTGAGNGGDINIEAPETIDISGDGKISVETTGAGDAGSIKIETQNLTTTDGIDITASTTGGGDAGNINITTNNFDLEAGTSLTTETDSSGRAGDITINSETLTIGEGAKISATALENATSTDRTGNITINSNELNIFGELGIFAETQGEAPAGTLKLNTYNDNPDLNINFSESGFISARTFSSGNGGNIEIFAPESINITGDGQITVKTEGAGNAGKINIQTPNLTIAENITISAATSDSGKGGSINIDSSQTFQLDGQLLTETTGTGEGGNITINTGSLTAENGIISAKSTETATENAGSIEITAQENITTGIITSSANNATEAADGGEISITSEQGEINATQPIQSFSEQGNAGDVTLKAKTNVTTNIISSHGQQQGGQINITAETGNIDTSNGTLANYSGGGDGGNVNLTAPQGDITTSNIYSFADGDGGQINIKAGGEINLAENSNIISASEPSGEQGSGEAGRGGDIILEAGNNINTTTARIYSGADDGDTGKIEITADSTIETGQIDLASGFVRERLEFNDNNNFTLIPKADGEATQGFAGDISIKSNNGTIDTTAGTINSRSPDGSGDITIEALSNITTGKLEASALNTTKPTTGGDITIISQQGEIYTTEAIETFSEQGTAGSVNIEGAGHVEVNTILSQGTQQGGDITIHSSSENSINVQDDLNTFSTEGIAGNVTLTSPGTITIRGIRSEGMEQGGNITVESGIGEIDATGGDIDSYSEQGVGGDVQLNALDSVNLANVSSYGMTESGDLTIQSQQAEVNTGNVTTEAPDGSSGSIVINGTEVGTGDLSSIGTTSAGEINVEATDGSIDTYDVEIKSEGTIGILKLRATEDVETGDITQEAGEGDANTDISSGGDQTTGDINQTAEEDTNLNQEAGGDIANNNITQDAGDDATINQDTSVNANNETANTIDTDTGNITNNNITQDAGDDATINQDT
ncbi:beta strand repeat-containing protein, partial [Dapis sp. BLCC M229]|uniref:beta strand repeat-containing protein n=1 Tax=Dapis sp. BLCC M229 TaxID=3400188 RepID=UPI003CEB81EE